MRSNKQHFNEKNLSNSVFRRASAVFLLSCLCLSAIRFFPQVNAMATSLDELRGQKEETDQQIDSLSDAKAALEGELGDMNSQLYSISNSISALQDEIDEQQTAIEDAQMLLDETQAQSEEQYANMKLRIQYLYENGGSLSWTTLLASGSFSDFLTKAQYMMDISTADRELLEEYQDTLAQIASYRQELTERKEELVAAQEELSAQKSSLLSSISSAKNALNSTSSQLANQQNLSADLAAQIAAMEEYERQLEAQKAAEAKQAMLSESRVEQIKQQEEDLAANRTQVSAADAEKELLAALIYCEAGGEGYDAQVAVGSVVINRVSSSYFPNSITEVIYQSRQFSPAASGKLALVLENGLTTDSCRNAASAVLSGTISGNWLYFCVNTGGIDGTIIGKQVFY
jgi:spore germination cell wall hydrolase CwlJ-like protein